MQNCVFPSWLSVPPGKDFCETLICSLEFEISHKFPCWESKTIQRLLQQKVTNNNHVCARAGLFEMLARIIPIVPHTSLPSHSLACPNALFFSGFLFLVATQNVFFIVICHFHRPARAAHGRNREFIS